MGPCSSKQEVSFGITGTKDIIKMNGKEVTVNWTLQDTSSKNDKIQWTNANLLPRGLGN